MLLTPELESGKLDRSATTLHICNLKTKLSTIILHDEWFVASHGGVLLSVRLAVTPCALS